MNNPKHGIAIGDRLLLLKQEVKPRGIVGSGTVSGLPFEDAHWNNKPGATTNHANITFDVVLDPNDVRPVERLLAELCNTHWSPQSSGTSVHPLGEGTLEGMWVDHAEQA